MSFIEYGHCAIFALQSINSNNRRPQLQYSYDIGIQNSVWNPIIYWYNGLVHYCVVLTIYINGIPEFVHIKQSVSLWIKIVYILWGAVLLFISKMWYHLAFDVISPWLLCDITLELSDITNWTKWYHLIIKVISHNCDNLVISPRVWSDIT